MRLLIVEDNRDIAANIGLYFEQKGHVVDFAYDGAAGLRLATDNPYDGIVLDLMLPLLDGVEVCRALRGDAGVDTPVLMLTARDTLDEKLDGFSSGADDYMVKPFSMLELEARLHSLVRRFQGKVSAKDLHFLDLHYDAQRMTFERAGMPVVLKPITRNLLLKLMRAAGAVVSREELEYEIWGDSPPAAEALRVHIHALRTALDKPFASRLLHTVRGTGYRLGAADE